MKICVLNENGHADSLSIGSFFRAFQKWQKRKRSIEPLQNPFGLIDDGNMITVFNDQEETWGDVTTRQFADDLIAYGQKKADEAIPSFVIRADNHGAISALETLLGKIESPEENQELIEEIYDAVGEFSEWQTANQARNAI